MGEKKCIWKWVNDGASYETACDNGADHYNEIDYFKYCPYCRLEIVHAYDDQELPPPLEEPDGSVSSDQLINDEPDTAKEAPC